MRQEKSLSRKTLMLNAEALRALKQVLKAPTESEAVRIAVEDRLALEEAQVAFQRIRSRGGLDDAFCRSSLDTRKEK